MFKSLSPENNAVLWYVLHQSAINSKSHPTSPSLVSWA